MEQMKKIIFKLRIINCILILVVINNIAIFLCATVHTSHTTTRKVQKDIMMCTGRIIKSYVLPDFQDQFDKDFNVHIEGILDHIQNNRRTFLEISNTSFFNFGVLMIVFILQFLLAKDITRIKKTFCFQEGEECVSKEKKQPV